ncbi:hypothetical protein CLV59_10146 [Chitinophaga dinghuensis]|uniref:Uncharacterized protein n=1 Tax=Chitinophaga dinghuensis TaxID=1539050 RepID=A0A327W9B0_9BACT|nr:hypothetical protein [Chitinophaga dinghuensis]RAJ87297.1 hypothetical protein CLV59_10146 [Chitinophaga dinghuensis]
MKRFLALFLFAAPLALQAQSKLAQNIIDDFSSRAAYHYQLKNDSIMGYIAEQLTRSGAGGLDIDSTVTNLSKDPVALDAALKYLYQYSDCNRQRFIENLREMGLKTNNVFPVATYTANKYKDQTKELLDDKKDFLVTYTGPHTGNITAAAPVAAVQSAGNHAAPAAASSGETATENATATAAAAPTPVDTRNWEVKPVFQARTTDQLATLYGKENIGQRDGSDIGGNATGKIAYVVYPESDDELEINMDGDNGNVLIFAHEHTKWKTPFGIKPGDPLEKLNKINGRAFKINGFEWADGGMVISWEGGQLDGKGVTILLKANNTGDPKQYDQVTGDKKLRSDMPALKKLDIVIQSIAFKSN